MYIMHASTINYNGTMSLQQYMACSLDKKDE